MKKTWPVLFGLLLLAAPTVQAQTIYNYDNLEYTTNGDQITIIGYTGPDGNVTIPTNINGLPVTSIAQEAFYTNNSVTSITIPDSVTSIGEGAFFLCASLTNATIGDGVTSIGEGAFEGCGSLTAIMVNAQNPFYSSENGVLFDESQTTLIQYPGGTRGGYVIPNGVTNIGSVAFRYCERLISVAIPGSLIGIGNQALEACESLTNATIANGVTGIGGSAFSDCALTTVTIPGSVINIEEYSFAGCGSLSNVYFFGNAPIADSFVFSGDINATVYYLPGTTGWSSPFAGLPAVLWSWSPPLPATATAIVTNGFAVSVPLSQAGIGYTNTPLVYFVGGGDSGAQAIAMVSNGIVTGITVTDAGFGYTNAPSRRTSQRC